MSKKQSSKSAPAPKTAAKKHERKAKPSEEEMLAKGRALAANYLIERDGIDLEIALMVVGSMEATDINQLLTEATDATIAKTAESMKAATGATLATGKVEPEPIDFTDIPALAEDEELAGLIVDVKVAGSTKNSAEKDYKEKKKILVDKLKAAGIRPDLDVVTTPWAKLTLYVGHSIQLNENLLLEAGVSIDLIKKGYKDTSYEDVRFGKVE